MKKITLVLFATILSISIFAQKKGEIAKEPWLEVFTRAPFLQGKDGLLLLEITNRGTDVDNCIAKAKQQAVFTVIFTGYEEANNIPAAPALSPTDIALYNEKVDFFKEFFTNSAIYGSFTPEAKINTKKPVGTIDKKTVEASIIVTVSVDRLRKQLEAQNIIKSLVQFGVKPTLIIVPSDTWMKNNGYVTEEDAQGVKNYKYDYLNAVSDEKIKRALDEVSNKFGGPSGAFKVQNIKSKLDAINIEVAKNNARTDGKKESNADLFARTLAADLWIKIDYTKEMLEGGLKSQFTITLAATDPFTGEDAIPGKPIMLTSTGDNATQLLVNAMNGAAADFKPRVFDYFKNRQEKGIQGKLTISLLDQVDFDFDTEFTYKDEEKELKAILQLFIKKGSNERLQDGEQTNTTFKYDVTIPVEFSNEEGQPEKNSFSNYGSGVASQIKKFGFTCKTESTGLGKVEIIITGKKQ